MTVLETFVESPGPASLTEIAERSGIGRSATQRVLHTLTQLGHLKPDPENRKYVPTLRLLSLAGCALRSHPLSEIAIPHMVRLADEIDESVHLSQLDENEIVYLQRLPRHEVRSLGMTVGSRRPALSTAAGRSMLSLRPSEEVAAVLERVNAPTAETLRQELEQARSNGWSFVSRTVHSEETAVAAPILDSHGVSIAAVSVPLSTQSYNMELAAEKIVPPLLEATRAITIQLSGFAH